MQLVSPKPETINPKLYVPQSYEQHHINDVSPPIFLPEN